LSGAYDWLSSSTVVSASLASCILRRNRVLNAEWKQGGNQIPPHKTGKQWLINV
jgi:hypothetical protein